MSVISKYYILYIYSKPKHNNICSKLWFISNYARTPSMPFEFVFITSGVRTPASKKIPLLEERERERERDREKKRKKRN
jgi:hypothetical protein